MPKDPHTIVRMRGFLASSIGVTCAAALALPLTLPTASHAAPSPTREAVPGSTQSLPLESSPGSTSTRAMRRPQEQGLTRRDVRPFSLVGVVWDDPDTQLHGHVQVRTRTTDTTRWSSWQDVETHNDDAPDLDTPERAAGSLHGSTAPLWVGDSDGVEVRVKADEPDTERAAQPSPLPKGLRLELVDPGEEPPQGSRAEGANSRRHPRARQEADGGRTDRGPRRQAYRGRVPPVHRPAPAHHHAQGLGRQRETPGTQTRLHQNRQGRLRPPQCFRQQLPLLASPFSHPQYLPLPRQEQWLA